LVRFDDTVPDQGEFADDSKQCQRQAVSRDSAGDAQGKAANPDE